MVLPNLFLEPRVAIFKSSFDCCLIIVAFILPRRFRLGPASLLSSSSIWFNGPPRLETHLVGVLFAKSLYFIRSFYWMFLADVDPCFCTSIVLLVLLKVRDQLFSEFLTSGGGVADKYSCFLRSNILWYVFICSFLTLTASTASGSFSTLLWFLISLLRYAWLYTPFLLYGLCLLGSWYASLSTPAAVCWTMFSIFYVFYLIISNCLRARSLSSHSLTQTALTRLSFSISSLSRTTIFLSSSSAFLLKYCWSAFCCFLFSSLSSRIFFS